MGVVLPHHRPGARAVNARVVNARVVNAGAVAAQQPVQGVGHVAVADVPGLGPAADHRPVVALGARGGLRVLLGDEPLVQGTGPGPRRGLGPSQFAQQRDDLRLAAGRHQPAGQRVGLRVLAVGLEAAQRLPRGGQMVGLVLGEVVQHRAQRLEQAVDVQAVEPDPALWRQPVVVAAQPARELHDLLVGPHPPRPAGETRQRLPWVGGHAGRPDDVAVHSVAVRPVSLDADEGESLLGHQAPGSSARQR